MGKKKEELEVRKDNRLRLNEEEMELVEYFRETGTLPDTHLIRSDMSTIKLKEKCLESDRRYKKLLKEHGDSQKRLDVALALKDDKSSNSFLKPLSSKIIGDATAVMVASDWHVEENVDPSTVNWVNEYNPDIAKERAEKFFQKGLWLTNLVRKGIKIDTLVFAILGDMISGYIHDELAESNHKSPTEAILFAQRLLRDRIDFLLKNGKFKKILIPCCFGNHGRTTLKRRVSTSYKNSFEWMMFHQLKDHYSSEKRVEFVISNGYHVRLPLYDNFTMRFHHGDNIRYGGGVGGISVPVNKAIKQWNTNEPADIDVFGHFHQQFDGGKFISNGSLVGWNAFANSIKAEYDVPQQSFFVVDKKRGKIMVAPIYVADK